MALLAEKGFKLALAAHEGQKRHEGTPYITHPVAVALMLARHSFGDEVLAAALCHDVLEDTSFTEGEMRQELGGVVTDIVKAVSYDRSLPYKEQRERYIESVRQAGEGAMAVSIADKIHNAQSLLAMHAKDGPSMWGKFNASREQKMWFEEEVLRMFKESWQHPLVGEYEALVAELRALS